MRGLLSEVLTGVRVSRVGWVVSVEPGAWFDAVAAATPRTGAVLAAASADQRAASRKAYVEAARAAYGTGAGLVELPASAVLGSGTRD